MKAASQKLLQQRGEKNNDQWNEPWRDPSSQLTWLKFSQDIQEAKQKGFTAIEPDNSAELTNLGHLVKMCTTLKNNQMKLIVKNENMGAWFTAARHQDCKAVIAAILPEGAIARNEVEKMERIRKSLGSEVPIFYVEYGDDWKKDPKKLDGLKESEKRALLSKNTTVVHLPDRKIARGVSDAGCVAFEKKESDDGVADKSKNDILDIYKKDQGLGVLRESVDTTKCNVNAPVGSAGSCVQFSDLTPLAVPKNVLPKSI
ncbi:MAG: hypothetical protein WAX38_00245 [Minisyncoccia bacterium]